METPDEKPFLATVTNRLTFVAGTAVKQIPVVERSLAGDGKAGHDLFGGTLLFDWDAKPPVELGSLLGDATDGLFGPDAFIPAVLPPDAESLLKAEEDGRLCFMPAGWYLAPRTTADDLGASGDPRIGLTLALLNEGPLVRKIERELRQIVSHDRQAQQTLLGVGSGAAPARVLVDGTVSAIGGMGAGVMYWFPRAARRCAEAEGVQAKLMVNLLLRGNLPAQDRQRADLNQLALLKHLRAYATGQFVDPVTGQLERCPFDALFLSGNSNRHGNLPTLDRLLIHEGHSRYQLLQAPAGAKLRERLADVENWNFDEFGDPLAGLSMATAYISRDSKRVLAFCNGMGAALFADGLRTEGDVAKARRHALGLARLHELVESDEENQVTNRLLHPAELDGDSILNRARADLDGRIGPVRGLQRAIAIDDALKTVRGGDMPGTFEPVMKRQAQTKCNEVRTALEAEFDRQTRLLGGLQEAREIAAVLRAAAANSQRAVMGKIRHLQQVMAPHEEILAAAQEKLELLRKGGFWVRLANLFLPGRLAANFESSGHVVLDCQVQIAACTVAAQELLTPIVEHLDRKLAWLTALDRKLQDVGGACRQASDHWAKKPTALTAPLGYELATPEYLQAWFDDRLKERGGERRFIVDMMAAYVTKQGSLSPVVEMAAEEVQEAFQSLAVEHFGPAIERADVMTELRRLYPDRATQQRIVEQCVHQSEGRLVTAGEGDREVTWIKVVTVPSLEYADWAIQTLEGVDRKAGRWEAIVDPNSDRLAFIQLRGGISLTPSIARMDKPDMKDWPALVSQAPDPTSVLAVGPNPDDRQFRRVLAKAIITGLMQYDPSVGFSLDQAAGEPIPLGRQARAAMETLRRRWPDLIFVESTFARQLVLDDRDVVTRLRRLETDLSGLCPNDDPRLSLVDAAAIAETARQIELLVPWARRLRKPAGIPA